MKTCLLTFPDDKARDRFLKLVKDASSDLAGAPTTNEVEAQAAVANGAILLNALKSVRLDPPIKTDQERIVALFVSNQKMAEGQLSDMRKRFQQECDSHKGSVELRELREGEWVVIASRRFQ